MVADALHLEIFGKDVGDDVVEALVATDQEETAEEFGAEALALRRNRRSRGRIRHR